MNLQISPLQPREYRQVMALLDAEKPFPYLPDAFTPLWSVTPDGIPKALWAIRVDGNVVGGAGYVRAEGNAQLGCIGLIVAPAYRQQGIGSQIYTALVTALQKRAIRQVLTKVYAHQQPGLHFLARQGFRATGGSILSQLDVAAAQLEPWANPDAVVNEQGLHFTTLDRLPRWGLAERLLPIWNRTRPEQPQDWPYVPYSLRRFEQEIFEPGELALEHSFALVTADQRIIAVTLSIYYQCPDEPSHLFTVYSAVDPDFRRRKLATALKIKLIAHAQAHNIAFLTAENDERNQAMWQINHRLGYRRLADLRVYHQSILPT